MTGLPEGVFANPVWASLQTAHRRFAVSTGAACRYPRAVVPFAAVREVSVEAMRDLATLLEPGELVWVAGEELPSAAKFAELKVEQSLWCLQMVLPDEVQPGDANSIVVEALSCADAGEMVGLTDVAFPGFFRALTCEMGSHFGVRDTASGRLVAMGGERMQPEGYPEVSGICTHPEHRGRGLAEAVVWRVVREQRLRGAVSWLHVSASNARAIGLYERMGFVEARRILLHQVRLEG
jgi:ribosomal protein S18 acetylase RimI-like enzyme